MTASHAPTLSPEGKAALDTHLSESVAAGDLPALFFSIYNVDGPVYSACKGDKILGHPEQGQVDDDTSMGGQLTLTTALQLFSMTKLVVSVACLQLAEKGLVDFDDPDLVSKYCPELTAMPLLEGFTDAGEPITTTRKSPITLRQLLTHTSGLAYSFTLPAELRWEQATNRGKWFQNNATVDDFATPTHFEPGTRFCYSTSIDWAGILVWRLTGQTLDEYFNEHIWKPTGVTGMSFYPTDDIKKHLMGMSGRDSKGGLVAVDGFRPTQSLTPDQIGVLAGGAGLIGTVKGYMRFLQHLLACKDKEGGILSPASFKLLFTNALPPRAETTAYTDLPGFLGPQKYIHADLLDGNSIDHSLGLAVTKVDSPDGRPAGSGFWGGVAKTRYWIDPVNGLIVSAKPTRLTLGLLRYPDHGAWHPAPVCRCHG